MPFRCMLRTARSTMHAVRRAPVTARSNPADFISGCIHNRCTRNAPSDERPANAARRHIHQEMTHGTQAVEPNLHGIDMPFRTPAPNPSVRGQAVQPGGGKMSQQQPPEIGLPADPLHHVRTALPLRARGERVSRNQLEANPTTFHELAAAASPRRPTACRPAALARHHARRLAPTACAIAHPAPIVVSRAGRPHTLKKLSATKMPAVFGRTSDTPAGIAALRASPSFRSALTQRGYRA